MTLRKEIATCTAIGLLILAGAWLGAQSAQPKQKASPAGTSAPAANALGGATSSASGDHTENDAMCSMQLGHHVEGPHMHMAPGRVASFADFERADQIATTLGAAIERYRDYRVALADGYRIFLPNVPQDQYHFTNYWNGFVETFTFDPARPTALLYQKTKDGYRLVGAMYTAPKNASLDELNERVPLGVARWHAHTNLCVPPDNQMAHADWTRFGLTGSITTAAACSAAGGNFYPQIFGWMVHVYPFATSREKVFAQ